MDSFDVSRRKGQGASQDRLRPPLGAWARRRERREENDKEIGCLIFLADPGQGANLALLQV